MATLPVVTDNDDFTLAGTEVNGKVVYQYGEGIGITDMAGYEKLLELAEALGPEFSREEAQDIDI